MDPYAAEPWHSEPRFLPPARRAFPYPVNEPGRGHSHSSGSYPSMKNQSLGFIVLTKYVSETWWSNIYSAHRGLHHPRGSGPKFLCAVQNCCLFSWNRYKARICHPLCRTEGTVGSYSISTDAAGGAGAQSQKICTTFSQNFRFCA